MIHGAAVASAGVLILGGCSSGGPATETQLCKQFDSLGSQLLQGNGIIGNPLFHATKELGDLARRYPNNVGVAADGAALKKIGGGESLSGGDLENATQHIADVCGHPLGIGTSRVEPNPSSVTKVGAAPSAMPDAVGSDTSGALSGWDAFGGAQVSEISNGISSLTFSKSYWGGAVSRADVGCDYSVALQAKLVSGLGYGVLVHGTYDANRNELAGDGFQYDLYGGGYRYLTYPNDSAGDFEAKSLDNNWHDVRMTALGNQFAVWVDGVQTHSGKLASAACGSPALRVWNGSIVEVRGVSVVRATSLN
jgi:hypothetical protein